MGMFSEIFGLFKAMAGDLENAFSPHPKKRKPHLWHDSGKVQQDPSSYEPWDFLTKEQWQEIYDGKKSLQDYMMEPHVWPPQMEKNEQETTEEKEQNEDSADTESGENISDGETSENDSGNAEPDSAGNDSIDSYENSVSEPDLSGSDAFESDSGDGSAGDSESEV